MRLHENFYFLRSEQERNLACAEAGGEALQQRRENIEQMPNPILRRWELRSLEQASADPAAVAAKIDRHIEYADGLEYIGADAHFTHLANNHTTIKQHRLSAYMSEDKRESLANKLHEQVAVLEQGMGRFAIHSAVYIGPNLLTDPKLRQANEAVKISQPKIDYLNPDIFPAYDSRVNENALEMLTNRELAAARIIAELGLDLSEKGYALDTSAMNNVVIPFYEARHDNPALVCLNTVPLTPEDDKNGFDRVVAQLTDLQHKLEV